MTSECQTILEKKRERANKLNAEMTKMEDSVRRRSNNNNSQVNLSDLQTHLNIRERTRYADMNNELRLLNSQIAQMNREFENFNNQQNGIFRKIMQVVNGYNPNRTN